MTGTLLLVSGTGTGIGKTHVSEALVHAWARVLREDGSRGEVAGLKPVETGVTVDAASDRQTLEQASTFHVKRYPPPYMLVRAVSPHLAAADEGVTIEREVIHTYVEEVRREAAAVVVELAGALFSPLAVGLSNADVAQHLAPDGLLLVAPDRLGVLHDVGSAVRAAAAQGLSVSGIVLVAPEKPDASTGTNAVELRVVTEVPVVAVIAREPVMVTAGRGEIASLLRGLR